MKMPQMKPHEGSSWRELGVVMTRTKFKASDGGLAEGIECLEEIVAGGDTDVVGEWARTIYLKNGQWYAHVECSYGLAGLELVGGALDGLEIPGPIDWDAVVQTIGPFESREDALSGIADRLLACTALLAGAWEPEEE